MISMARVDDRLIHGQVAVMWAKQLGISRIIVANDTIAKNDIQKSALMLAAPEGVRAFILPVKKAISLINDPRSKDMKILLLSNNPFDIYNVLTEVTDKPGVNIANYGRISGGLSTKVKLTDTLYVNEADQEVIQQIIDLGLDCFYQPSPSDTKIEMSKILGGS